MSSKFEYPQDPNIAKKIIDGETKSKHLRIKAGWLGRFFGDSRNVSLYIVGLISLLLLLSVIIYTFIPENYRSSSLSPEKLWGIILPVITTLIGYIFGFNTKSDKEVE